MAESLNLFGGEAPCAWSGVKARSRGFDAGGRARRAGLGGVEAIGPSLVRKLRHA